ncbi:hypothetical protein Vafri_12928 [Volvox africanus]|uniref:CUB domain-containing protein n=1 Tax=Volvox africanus TaxID=51714 RepID=A0A8J4F358_9CHLO|nr:hypothetical protein Vafri_12928 [Volvox africanus]
MNISAAPYQAEGRSYCSMENAHSRNRSCSRAMPSLEPSRGHPADFPDRVAARAIPCTVSTASSSGAGRKSSGAPSGPAMAGVPNCISVVSDISGTSTAILGMREWRTIASHPPEEQLRAQHDVESEATVCVVTGHIAHDCGLQQQVIWRWQQQPLITDLSIFTALLQHSWMRKPSQQHQLHGRQGRWQSWRRPQAHGLTQWPSAVLLLLLLLNSASINWSLAAGQPTTNTISSSSSNSGNSNNITSSSSSTGGRSSGSSDVKWTFLIYMLADNNLECFGILDLIEMMEGMAQEPASCLNSACGAGCQAGYTTTTTTSCGSGKVISRCCPSAAYPDVLVLADRGVTKCTFSTSSGLDYSLLASTWTTAKELLVLPGGALQQVRDLGEIDMAAPDQLADFLRRGFTRFPPSSASSSASSTTTRKYALVLWDHGNGWKGYGVDDTCSSSGGSSSSGCDQFTISSLATGLASGLAGQAVSKLDVLGFDACLMSMFEVGGTLAPYARTLLASEMLEPGHGWDYRALGAVTKAAASSSVTAMAAEVAMAEIWIAQYKAQAVQYQTTGVTLALADLSVATANLVPAISSLADALRAALTANSTYSSGVLRRRMAMAAVGTGEQESSVDLGSMLTELRQATELDTASRAAAVTATAAYNATLLAYGRDDAMPAGTGLAIYFPAQAAKMDPDYLKLTSSSSTAVLAPVAGRWAAFLAILYNASVEVASSESSFSFLQVSAASVPYIDVASGSYVLQGVLNSPLALSAQSYYGFVDATEESYILAGTQPALVDGVSVIGTWRRFLWGVTQTLNATSSTNSTTTSTTTTSTLLAPQQQSSAGTSVTFSSLMFAAESWTTSADGTTATSVSLSANVRYGDTCSSTRSTTSSAVLKYTYRFATGRATLQLFAQQPSGAYGEVSAQAGGVIVPVMYKLPTDFSGPQSTTYEYSGCLKWGYNGTVRVVVVTMDDAADTLGVDVREDMLMFLVARDLSLSKAAYLVGSFSLAALADISVGGCQCLTSWRLNASDPATYKGCANPDNDTRGPWCPVLVGSCIQPEKALGPISNTSRPYDYCSSSRTLAGCSCSQKYATDGTGANFAYGKCYRGDNRAEARGAWCTVNNTTCPTKYRAHGSNDTSYDYCETQTVEGCYCVNSWTYNSVTYNGTCATGFYPDNPPEGFSNSSRWCRVQPGCGTRNQLNGRRIGLCGPAAPRRTTANATCVLPATVWGGVVVQNCVPWRNGPAATDLRDGISPMCPLDANATTFGTCLVRNCTALDMSACPATSPQSTSQLTTSSWLSRRCLEQLCAAALVSRDNTTCTDDGIFAATAFAQLNASTAAAGVIRSSYSAGSLDGFCTTLIGTDCLLNLMLPACPAIRLNGTAAFSTAYVDDSNVSNLCRTDCVKALCAVSSTKCARSQLVESLRLTLLEAMDAKCSSALTAGNATATIFSRLSAGLLCAQLTAAPATCAPLTTLTSASGDISLQPLSGSSQYAALTNCTWRIQPAGLSYIKLTFTSFDTEPLYDTLLVQDGDGVVAVVSGSAEGLPRQLVTDTGVLTLTFTSDSSIQRSGFTASYTAATVRSLPIPACGNRYKLAMFTIRTADYGNENGWVVGGYRILSSSGSNGSSGADQRIMLTAGGQLPPGAYSLFPSSNVSLVSTDGQYRNSRSYVTYGCLPTGLSMLYLYDGYGDGWSGGWLAVSYMPTPSNSYLLLNASLSGLNSTLPLQILASMPGSAADYSASLARNKGSGRFRVKFTLRLSGEVAGGSAISEMKQLILRGAVAACLSVDITTVAIQSMAAGGSTSSSGRRSLASHSEDDAEAAGKVELTAREPTDALPASAVVEAVKATGPSQMTTGGVAAAAAAQKQHQSEEGYRVEEEEDNGQVLNGSEIGSGALEERGVPVDAVAEEEPLVHGEGVVEALLARARELGLQPMGAGKEGEGYGSAEDMPVAAGAAAAVLQRRQRRRGRALQGQLLTELLSDQRLAGSSLAEVVSVQQPYFLWKKDAAAGGAAAEGTPASGSSTSTSTSTPSSSGAAAAAAAGKEKTPPAVDTESATSSNESTTAVSSSSELGIPPGYTLLSNGLVVGTDGVPLISKGTSTAESGGTYQVDNNAAVPRTLVSVAAESEGGRVALPQSGGSGTGHLGLPREAPAIESMEEVVAAMHRDTEGSWEGTAARALRHPVRQRSGRGRNGGRTPVPALQQLLPELLRRGAQHLATVATATAVSCTAANGDAADAAVGVAAPGGKDRKEPPAVGDMDETIQLAASNLNGGEAGWRVVAAAGTAGRTIPGATVRPSGADRHPRAAPSLNAAVSVQSGAVAAMEAAATAAEKASTTAAAAVFQVQPVGASLLEGAEPCPRDRCADGTRGPDGVSRRRLQQASSSAAVDVVLLVTGYGTQTDAEAAAAKVQSSVPSDLSNILGDTGWNYAAPSLVGTTQLYDGDKLITSSSSSSSGTDWTKMGIIIGAAAGGALLLLLIVLLGVYLVRRGKESDGAKVAPAKTINVAPPPPSSGRQAGQAVPPLATSKSARVHNPLSLEEVEAKVKAQQQREMQMRMEMQQAMLRRQQEQLQMMQQQLAVQSSARSGALLAGPPPGPAAAALVAARRQPSGIPQQLAGGGSRRGAMAAGGPGMGPWMNHQMPDAMAAAPGAMATPVMAMNPGAIPGMYSAQTGVDPYMMAAMDPYGVGGPYGDPYDMAGAGYDPYGAYGDPYVGAYPAPPAAWGGVGAGMPRMGWQ